MKIDDEAMRQAKEAYSWARSQFGSDPLEAAITAYLTALADRGCVMVPAPEWVPISSIGDFKEFARKTSENIWINTPDRGPEYVAGHMSFWLNWKPTHYCKLAGFKPPPPTKETGHE